MRDRSRINWNKSMFLWSASCTTATGYDRPPTPLTLLCSTSKPKGLNTPNHVMRTNDRPEYLSTYPSSLFTSLSTSLKFLKYDRVRETLPSGAVLHEYFRRSLGNRGEWDRKRASTLFVAIFDRGITCCFTGVFRSLGLVDVFVLGTNGRGAALRVMGTKGEAFEITPFVAEALTGCWRLEQVRASGERAA